MKASKLVRILKKMRPWVFDCWEKSQRVDLRWEHEILMEKAKDMVRRRRNNACAIVFAVVSFILWTAMSFMIIARMDVNLHPILAIALSAVSSLAAPAAAIRVLISLWNKRAELPDRVSVSRGFGYLLEQYGKLLEEHSSIATAESLSEAESAADSDLQPIADEILRLKRVEGEGEAAGRFDVGVESNRQLTQASRDRCSCEFDELYLLLHDIFGIVKHKKGYYFRFEPLRSPVEAVASSRSR
ncbi:MAG: hypothetical protein ABSF56_00660 [Minisyncoccia bacterium]|jgi:hypothetical protein